MRRGGDAAHTVRGFGLRVGPGSAHEQSRIQTSMRARETPAKRRIAFARPYGARKPFRSAGSVRWVGWVNSVLYLTPDQTHLTYSTHLT